MKILFITSFLDPSRETEINSHSIGPRSTANSLLQLKYMQAFSLAFSEVRCMNMPNIGSYPLRYKSAIFSGSDEYILNGCYVKTLSFINISIIKVISRFISIFKELLVKKKLAHSDVLFIYDLNVPVLAAVAILKLFYSNFKLIAIVPDINGMTGQPRTFFQKVYDNIASSVLLWVHRNIDGYILTTIQMRDLLPVDNKPFIVVEGIAPTLSNNVIPLEKKFIITYVGAVNSRNNVDLLVDAVLKLNNPDISLVVCGDGDLADYVINKSDGNTIVYKGQIPNNEVFNIYNNTSLLVNPRDPHQDFTKYSFPSKLLEYMSVGVPVLTSRLPGIPVEYDPFLFFIDECSVDSISDSINNIYNTKKSKRLDIAKSARLFVEERKTIIPTSDKLRQFVERICCE